MKRTGVGLLALSTVLLLGSWVQAAPANQATLRILVVDETGLPVEGVPLSVQTGKGDLVLATDETGTAVFEVKVTGNGPEQVVLEVLGGGSEGSPFTVTRGMEEEITVFLHPFSPIWTIDETDGET